MIIRIAKLSDASSIAKLSTQLGYSSQEAEIKQRLQEILSSTIDCIFVAEENKSVIGWIHCFYAKRIESNPFVEIGGLVIDINQQKKGIGKLLVKKVNSWSKTKQCKKVRVRCNSVRKGAHSFYEKTGFHLNKEQKIFDLKIE